MTERPLACPDWQEDLAAWVVAQLPPDREAALGEHLAGCPTCAAEAQSLLAVAAVTLGADPDEPLTGPEEPPAHLGERIMTAVASERRRRRLARAALAALAGVAAAIVAVVLLGRGGDPPPLSGREVAFAVVPEGAWAQAVVAPDPGGSVVQLTAGGLDPDTTYSFWLTPPGGSWADRVPAGTFRPAADGSVDVRLRCALRAEDYGRAWATTPDGRVVLDTE